MPRSLLERAGRSLWGEYWQAAMSRELGVSDRTVRRWVAGDYPVPPGVYADLIKIISEHHETLSDLLPELAKASE